MTEAPAAAPFTECTRFVFCRPHGGLNDIFCQLELCWRYAETFDRALILDGCTCGMLGSFSPFLVPKESKVPVFTNVTPELFAHLTTLSCHPRSIEGRIHEYLSVLQPDIDRMVVSDSREVVTFDMDRDYAEQVLVHEQPGGGTLSQAGITRVTLAPQIIPTVEAALQKLPPDYIGIHVRNTDLRTAYGELFEELFVKVTGENVLICSDDPSVVSFGMNYFELSKVYSSSEAPNLDGKATHHPWSHPDDATKLTAVIASIIDLLALGGAEKLYFTKVLDGRISGFSRLAEYISQNKSIRESLLGKT